MTEPEKLHNNVYGILICNSSLEKPSKILKSTFGLSDSEVYVYRSQFYENEFLKVRTNIYDLKTEPIDQSSEHLFNGEVLGSKSEVIARVKNIADVLNKNDCQCSFEIYNNNLEFIYEYPEKR